MCFPAVVLPGENPHDGWGKRLSENRYTRFSAGKCLISRGGGGGGGGFCYKAILPEKFYYQKSVIFPGVGAVLQVSLEGVIRVI